MGNNGSSAIVGKDSICAKTNTIYRLVLYDVRNVPCRTKSVVALSVGKNTICTCTFFLSLHDVWFSNVRTHKSWHHVWLAVSLVLYFRRNRNENICHGFCTLIRVDRTAKLFVLALHSIAKRRRLECLANPRYSVLAYLFRTVAYSWIKITILPYVVILDTV